MMIYLSLCLGLFGLDYLIEQAFWEYCPFQCHHLNYLSEVVLALAVVEVVVAAGDATADTAARIVDCIEVADVYDVRMSHAAVVARIDTAAEMHHIEIHDVLGIVFVAVQAVMHDALGTVFVVAETVEVAGFAEAAGSVEFLETAGDHAELELKKPPTSSHHSRSAVSFFEILSS